MKPIKEKISIIKSFLCKDVKEFNRYLLSFLCLIFLILISFMSYKADNSYAVFIDTLNGTKTMEVTVKPPLDISGANKPILSENMIPIYYDEGVWRKADSRNLDKNYKWYDYDDKMWANSITVSEEYSYPEIAMDLTTNENYSEIFGATSTEEGLSFDGTDDYIKLPDDYEMTFPATYSVKFKTNSTNNQIIFGDYNTKAALGLYNSNTKLIVSLATSSYVVNTGGLELDTFYTIDIVYNSINDFIVYLDGTSLELTTANNNWSWTDTSSYIGKRATGTNFNGTIEKFLVYKDTLTPNQIKHNLSKNALQDENGIIQDNLQLYYNFKFNNREYYKNGLLGLPIFEEDILTMQVWVPRYKYTVWNYNSDGTITSDAQEIQIDFEEGTTTTGEIGCIDNIQGTSDGTSSGTEPTTSEICRIKTTNEECTDSACNGKTYTHPAFTFGEEELEGIWVGKFELATDVECTPEQYNTVGEGCNLETIKPLVKPDATSWRGAMISVFENNIMTMNDNGNKYGFQTSDDTHMIKNIEWGAVTYLSHSKYGTCTDGECTKVEKNSNTNNLTGCGPQSSGSTSSGTICENYYTTLGQTASTTGNIYGIYDMNSGADEYVMGNIVSIDGNTMMTGHGVDQNSHSEYSGILLSNGSNVTYYESYTGRYEYPNNKYYDKYSFHKNPKNLSISKLGDGIKEVTNDGWNSWYDGYSNIVHASNPWQTRGSSYSEGSYGGIFSSGTTWGSTSSKKSSRMIITQ